jgi:hypothetical protein
MAEDTPMRPLLSPVLRFTKEPRPEGIAGGGKSATGVRGDRLGTQRRALSTQFKALADAAADRPRFAGRVVVYASMFDDSLAPTWTPSDLFHSGRGARLVAPFRHGYLVEFEAERLRWYASLVEAADGTADRVDISRVERVRFHDTGDVLGARSIESLWEAARKADGGRAFLVWLMPLRTNEAAEALLQLFGSLRERLLLAPASLLEGPSVEANPLVRPALQRSLRAVAPVDRLNRAMREYRQHRRARTTAVLSSPGALAQFVASGAVFRIDPVTPVTATSPGEGREPDRPLPASLATAPIVGVVDGGMTASSYRPAEAWRADPLVPGASAEVKHGNRVTSLVVQGHEWNSNLVLPPLHCRVGTVQAIAKVGHGGPGPEELVAYLDAVVTAYPETRVWNLSFNQPQECEPDAVSYLGHALAELARRHGVLLVNSVGNKPGSWLQAPADCEAALTVGGRLQTASGKPGDPCTVSLSGPGPSGLLKPDLAHFSHVRALGGALVRGSSFATALASPLAAHTMDRLRDPTPDLVKALLIHRSDSDRFDPALGFGTTDLVTLPWECRPGTVTLHWRARLRTRAAYYWELPIPPALRDGGRLRGQGRLTAILNPHPMVTDYAGPNYFSARLNAAVQLERGGRFHNLLGSMDTDLIPEQIARVVDHKWSPVRHHARDFRRSGVQADGPNLRVYARVYTRDHYLYGYSSADEVPELDAVFVLSLVSPHEAGDIYDQVREQLGAFVEPSVIDAGIDIEAGDGL